MPYGGGGPFAVIVTYAGRCRARHDADLAAAINRLLADSALRERMGQAGRQRVEERFSWRVIAQRTADLYRSLARRDE